MRALRALREVALPEGCIGAGAIRNTVWDLLYGSASPSEIADVDVAYFDPGDLSRETEERFQRRLAQLQPDLPWEVINQAAVHLWHEKATGERARPHASLDDALGSWPETATAVAVRLDSDDRICVVAPLGLVDLFEGVVRRNAACVSPGVFEERVRSKRFAERWPRLRIVRA
ncbi:MAG: nucleotidyltransferase family protein [Deltaproteobacteria bacterium]|nr:nucleotidyltransferase family protein [Deltaproteobacteria bacterium]